MSQNPNEANASSDFPQIPEVSISPQGLRHEDILAILIGGGVLLLAFVCGGVSILGTDDPHPWKSLFGKPGSWVSNPIPAITKSLPTIIMPFVLSLLAFGAAQKFRGHCVKRFAVGFAGVFVLATVAFLMSSQETVKHFNLEYALWALLLGLIISNTIGTPNWMQPALLTELFVKSGLVILGAEVLLHRLLALGLPGIFVAWVVTPIVLITTYWFGQKILKIPSASLNMVISADMSVCGVSAAIATAASCKAKKEELSFAIGLSLIFTVIMMVAMPFAVRMLGLSSTVGGAWIGGTIDSTGAVVAAGAALDRVAEETAATVKMIQNILIGVTAFGVAVYWVTFVERDPNGARPQVSEIWSRFPKFVLGFGAASIAATLVSRLVTGGDELVDATVTGATTTVRSWFFCLAFVCIGLQTRFADYAEYLVGGKPVALYLCGQALNLVLTLAMAQLMFGVLFAESIENANQEPISNVTTPATTEATPEPTIGTLPETEPVELAAPKS
jgi:uncharacterized membrane protein YadS